MLDKRVEKTKCRDETEKGETADILLARRNNKARSNYIGNEDRKRDICTGRKGDGIAEGDVTMDDDIKS